MPLAVRVWDFVDRDFLTIRSDKTLADAMELLVTSKKKSGEIRQSLVVVNEKDKPLGIISMRNILDAFKPEFNQWYGLLGKDGWNEAMEKGLKQCNFRLVEDYMVKMPELKMSDDLIKALKILTEKNLQVRVVPIVEAEKIEGVVRIPDLFKAFFEAFKKMC